MRADMYTHSIYYPVISGFLDAVPFIFFAMLILGILGHFVYKLISRLKRRKGNIL